MFGYVTIRKPELKIKDFTRYQGYYCGICRSLRTRYGLKGQIVLNYDMVFLAALLTGLYEGKERRSMRRCVLHPVGKHLSIENPYIEYAADMTVPLSYYNLMDDWEDEKKLTGLLAAELMKKDCEKLKKQYPRQCRAMERALSGLRNCEKRNGKNLDEAAGYTGEMLGELLVFREDQWEAALRRIGFFLGKYIYLLDAYEDLLKDEKKENYNPLFFVKDKEDFEAWFESVLTMMMAECASAFERLPILKDIDILRNILYSGIWIKYELAKTERTGERNGSL